MTANIERERSAVTKRVQNRPPPRPKGQTIKRGA
jgi:hypothetical protein